MQTYLDLYNESSRRFRIFINNIVENQWLAGSPNRPDVNLHNRFVYPEDLINTQQDIANHVTENKFTLNMFFEDLTIKSLEIDQRVAASGSANNIEFGVSGDAQIQYEANVSGPVLIIRIRD